MTCILKTLTVLSEVILVKDLINLMIELNQLKINPNIITKKPAREVQKLY